MIGTARGQIPTSETKEGLGDLGAADVGLGCGFDAGRRQLHGEGNAPGFDDQCLQRKWVANGL